MTTIDTNTATFFDQPRAVRDIIRYALGADDRPVRVSLPPAGAKAPAPATDVMRSA